MAASIKALDIIEHDPELCSKPIKNAQLFTQSLGLPKAKSCIVPLVLQDPQRALQASQLLEEEGFLVTAIRPPTVPMGTARLRFAFTAAHNPKDIQRLTEIVKHKILKD